MSAISTTRFLDPYSTSFLSKNPWGSTSWALISSGSRSARSTKSPAKMIRNKLIKDWSIARAHHKGFVEACKRGGHRSGRATVRAPNHYRQVCGGRGGKSRDNRRTIKWDVSWNIQGHNKRTWRLGGRAGSTRSSRMPDNELNSKDQTSQLCLRSRHWNLEGKITTKVAIPREPLKLPVQLLLLSGRKTGRLGCDAGLLSGATGVERQLKRDNRRRQSLRPHLGT